MFNFGSPFSSLFQYNVFIATVCVCVCMRTDCVADCILGVADCMLGVADCMLGGCVPVSTVINVFTFLQVVLCLQELH